MKKLPGPNPTAREVLEHAGGEKHALCSVMKYRSLHKAIQLFCSCNETITAPTSPEALHALRHVPVAA